MIRRHKNTIISTMQQIGWISAWGSRWVNFEEIKYTRSYLWKKTCCVKAHHRQQCKKLISKNKKSSPCFPKGYLKVCNTGSEDICITPVANLIDILSTYLKILLKITQPSQSINLSIERAVIEVSLPWPKNAYHMYMFAPIPCLFLTSFLMTSWSSSKS